MQSEHHTMVTRPRGLQEVRRPGQSLRAAKVQLTPQAETGEIGSFESSNVKPLHSVAIVNDIQNV